MRWSCLSKVKPHVKHCFMSRPQPPVRRLTFHWNTQRANPAAAVFNVARVVSKSNRILSKTPPGLVFDFYNPTHFYDLEWQLDCFNSITVHLSILPSTNRKHLQPALIFHNQSASFQFVETPGSNRRRRKGKKTANLAAAQETNIDAFIRTRWLLHFKKDKNKTTLEKKGFAILPTGFDKSSASSITAHYSWARSVEASNCWNQAKKRKKADWFAWMWFVQSPSKLSLLFPNAY